jgi:hypothetical protein
LEGRISVSFWIDKDASNLRWSIFVALYAVLANIPFWAASHWLGLAPVGWFCLEYAGVGLLALFVPRVIAAVLLLLVIFADLTCTASKTYFLTPTECLVNVGFLRELPPTRLIALAAVAVLTLIVISAVAFFPVAAMSRTSRWSAAMCLISFAALSISADCVMRRATAGQIQNPFRISKRSDMTKFSEISRVWVGRYPLVRLARMETLLGRPRNVLGASRRSSSPVPSAAVFALASAGLANGKRGQKLPNVVIVLVESWGLDSDSSVRDSLVYPYSQVGLRARYSVVQGTVPFYGGTIAGEARELCGNSFGFHLLDASAAELSGCLPGRLAAMGYRTLAVHGMSGNMFRRSDWYSRIGFQEQWFHNEFTRQGLPDCLGAFFGTCDAAIADWIGRRLGEHDDPYFVHWVTLNSHLPVPVPSLLQNAASCSLTPLLSREPALCAWYQLVLNVHESVSRLAMTTLARPTVFVIVGDHAPPFTDPGLASQFSSTDVPYVLLVPRGDSESSTLVAGVANLNLRMRVAGRSSGATSHTHRIQYVNGVAHPAPAVCR